MSWPYPPAEGTFLTLLSGSASLIPLYAARGLKEDLRLIDESKQLYYDVNFNLVDFSLAASRKYALTVTGADVSALAFDGVYAGLLLTVTPATRLAYPIGAAPGRPAVAGSAQTVGNYTYYQAQLSMRVAGFKTNYDEWRAKTAWTLELREA